MLAWGFSFFLWGFVYTYSYSYRKATPFFPHFFLSLSSPSEEGKGRHLAKITTTNST